MLKELNFKDVLNSIKNGESISISGGKLHYINGSFCVGEMFGSIKAIDDEKAYAYIKEHVRDANLNNFLYKVVSNVKKANISCSVAKKPNWFAKYLVIDNTKYKIEINRCGSNRVYFSNAPYVSGLHITKEMFSWERKHNFNNKLNDESLEVDELYSPHNANREHGLTYLHTLNVRFKEIINSETNEDELVDLISDIIVKLF